jgi:monofunctional biosynthetic peptidoglycan transglycosylase
VRGGTISKRIGVVARDGLDACVYRDIAPPEDRAPPRTSTPDALPGEEYETARPLPPLEEAIEGLPASEPPLDAQENAVEPLIPQEEEPQLPQPSEETAPSPPPEPVPAPPPGT